ncbi:MAG: tRNA pseudouridine(55) synthase TruB [Spirochaetaceae bacterium]|jgi:tRNA pseudouridine55 synthase|nr:tRNA pseudouridine(55) synthase TruB [Spirochaetaceae bacterium]
MMNNTGGLILLNKPSEITSFRGLNVLKKSLGTGKVGHTGTLDKFADGLIVSLFGKMTKLVPEFTGMDKEYIALIAFGEETATLDPEGDVIFTAAPPDLNMINAVLPFFLGKIEQTPPQYSAIHINGKRAYELVREGKRVEIPSREIIVYDFDIISYNKPLLKVRIKCSKGTYIRSLARDLAIKCGSRAHLVELKRTEVGPFHLSQSVKPEEFNPETHIMKPWVIFDYLDHIDKKIIIDEHINEIKSGKEWILKEIASDFPDNREYALFDKNKEMIALIQKINGTISYRFVC